MKKQAEAWIGFAEKDMLTVSEIIKNPNLTNVVTFHCQQAIEKYFKAFLLDNEKLIMRIHNLLALYGTISGWFQTCGLPHKSNEAAYAVISRDVRTAKIHMVTSQTAETVNGVFAP